MKQFAVIGLGRFGNSLIHELNQLDCEVLAIDNNEAKVNEVADITTHALQADAMDEQALKSVGIRNFDMVVVAIGEDIQANILTTITLKELGVKKVMSRARNELHGRVLEKIGTDMVVYPERDMAIRLARSMTAKNFFEHIELSPDFSIVELATPEDYIGKELNELVGELNVNILAVQHGEEIIVTPRINQVIDAGDVLVVLGKNEELKKLEKKID
ncbi:MAG: TrkA family potassium uptake protein [Bacillota bacterium]